MIIRWSATSSRRPCYWSWRIIIRWSATSFWRPCYWSWRCRRYMPISASRRWTRWGVNLANAWSVSFDEINDSSIWVGSIQIHWILKFNPTHCFNICWYQFLKCVDINSGRFIFNKPLLERCCSGYDQVLNHPYVTIIPNAALSIISAKVNVRLVF